MLSFAEVIHTEVGPKGPVSHLWRNRLLHMAKEFFGTDGIRGIPGTPPLDDATLYATGRALAAYLHREHGAAHVLIGMDTRESGRTSPHCLPRVSRGLAHGCVCRRSYHSRRGLSCSPERFSSRRGYLRLAQSLSRQRREVVFARRDEFPDAVEESWKPGY